jgi:hypothetical protein
MAMQCDNENFWNFGFTACYMILEKICHAASWIEPLIQWHKSTQNSSAIEIFALPHFPMKTIAENRTHLLSKFDLQILESLDHFHT